MIVWHFTLLPPDAILGCKCTKNAFAEPRTPQGELTALPRPLAVFEGATSRQGKGGEGKGREEREMGGKGPGGRGGEGKGKGNGPSQLWEQIDARALDSLLAMYGDILKINPPQWRCQSVLRPMNTRFNAHWVGARQEFTVQIISS